MKNADRPGPSHKKRVAKNSTSIRKRLVDWSLWAHWAVILAEVMLILFTHKN
jgi:hypothetical protein